MLPLFDADADRAVELANAALGRFRELFAQHWLAGMRAKLGLFTGSGRPGAGRRSAGVDARPSADFTNTFQQLATGRLVDGCDGADPELEAWHRRLEERRRRQPQPPAEAEALMRRHNPAVIPRNHLVEQALAAATGGDLSVLTQLLEVLANPYDHDADRPAFREPAAAGQPYRTFCGT